ncbi:MAG: FkbM family methyltransferase [Clostridiales bacterium]|nr:FkbM family methyltransferase [Clostridiales bacterium]
MIIYGMGDGAEKIIAYLNSKGINVSGIFASEGFVRGQSFSGMKVISLEEIKEEFSDFIIITAFALEGEKSRIFYDLSEKYPLFSPNFPPYGEGCIDKDWCGQNRDRIKETRALFCDEVSRDIFDSLIEYNITADISCLISDNTPPEGWIVNNAVHIDIGAYNGDSVSEYVKANPDYRELYAFEPNRKTFVKLIKNTSAFRNVECINSAVGETDGVVPFVNKKGRGSSISKEGRPVSCVSLDSCFKDKSISSIKIDGEGAEREILKGAVNIIDRDKPSVCVAAYHKAFDLFDIPLWLKNQNPSYSFYLRRKEYIPAFDVFIYALKK